MQIGCVAHNLRCLIHAEILWCKDPEPFDLDATSSSDEPKTPRPSGLALSKPSGTAPPSSHGQNSTESLRPSNVLGFTADLGKAVVKAAVETERERREQLSDQLQAARHAAVHAYHSAAGNDIQNKGDEVLPHVNDDEGQPPEIRYQNGTYLFN